jgi:hypothetical protein
LGEFESLDQELYANPVGAIDTIPQTQDDGSVNRSEPGLIPVRFDIP